MSIVYEYRCRDCGIRRESSYRSEAQPCPCGGLSRRDYSSVQIGASAFKPHYNYSVGKHVNSQRDFEDALKRKAENNSVQTGMDHNYSPIDPSELRTMMPKQDTSILEDQARSMSDKNIQPVEASPHAF